MPCSAALPATWPPTSGFWCPPPLLPADNTTPRGVCPISLLLSGTPPLFHGVQQWPRCPLALWKRPFSSLPVLTLASGSHLPIFYVECKFPPPGFWRTAALSGLALAHCRYSPVLSLDPQRNHCKPSTAPSSGSYQKFLLSDGFLLPLLIYYSEDAQRTQLPVRWLELISLCCTHVC